MSLAEISKQLDELYTAYETYEGTGIGTHIYMEGDPINFIFCQEDDKYARIVTNRNFSERMAWCTNGWTKAAPTIERLAAPYGVQWDNDNGALFIRFRRNEMTIAQAILRLHQAVSVISALGSV